MLKRLTIYCMVLIVCSLVGIPVQAQDETTLRDPVDLARRYLDYDGEPVVLPLTPIYRVGDTLEFWVSRDEQPTRVNATLAATSPLIYLWVEEGLEYDRAPLGELAAELSRIYSVFRLRELYNRPLVLPGVGAANDPMALIPLPNVDNDSHLYILYTTDLNDDVIFNPNDSLPMPLVPGGYSNQHEVFYVNTTPYPAAPLHGEGYVNGLIEAFYPFVMSRNNPTQAPWLVQSLNLSLWLRLQESRITAQHAAAFLEVPNTSLLRAPTSSSQIQIISGQQMFINYLLQRYGALPYLDLFLQPGDGLAPLDAVLAKNNIIDPVTGAEVNGRDVFADFVMTNLLNFALGDGRYVHLVTPLEPNQRAAIVPLDAILNQELILNQFGTIYLRHTASAAGTIEFSFDGAPTVARLRMPADFDETFYWSGRGAGQNTTLTQTFDLSDLDTATLTFDVWYDLADEWNYGYVSVSTDDGTTWIPLPAESDTLGTTLANRHGVAYGPGYTGISNPEGPRPFPIMGVMIAEDGMSLGEITPGSPAAEAGLQPNDRIVGYDGELWQNAPNVIGMLENYAPGDTVNLYIQRRTERFDVPLVLGAHPERIVLPEPLWLPQTVDLTPFTGLEVLLRFEYISLPGRENSGFAVNNIAIPELEYQDDGEGWTLHGWQAVTNRVPQQWLVQAFVASLQENGSRVRPLIGVGSEETSGAWMFTLQTNETLVVAVSGLNDNTYERATFSASLREG